MSESWKKEPLSLYRGYGVRAADGELFLYSDPHLLERLGIPVGDREDPDKALRQERYREIRDWMTLDQKPANRSASMGTDPEGWSCFRHGELFFLARLIGTGLSDQGRVSSYFTHARVWSVDRLSTDQDPGALLGCSSAFDKPWKSRSDRLDTPVPDACTVWQELIRHQQETAAGLLAALYQGLVQEPPIPVIMGARPEDFAPGGRAHALVSFARAALPAALKRDCRIRVFSENDHMGEVFIASLRASLLVVPEGKMKYAIATPRDKKGSAIGGKDQYLLLDQDAKKSERDEASVKASHPGIDEYARVVTLCAERYSDTLLAFSARVDGLMEGRKIPDVEKDCPWIQTCFELAAILGGEKKDRRSALQNYVESLVDKGELIPWRRLLKEEEWDILPDLYIYEILLSPAGTLTLGERELQNIFEETLRSKRSADLGLGGIGPKADREQVLRILQLSLREPPLLSIDKTRAWLARSDEAHLIRLALAAPDQEPEWLDGLEKGLFGDGFLSGLIDELLNEEAEARNIFRLQQLAVGLMARPHLRDGHERDVCRVLDRILEKTEDNYEIPPRYRDLLNEIPLPRGLQIYLRLVEILYRQTPEGAENALERLVGEIKGNELPAEDALFILDAILDPEGQGSWKSLSGDSIPIGMLLQLARYLPDRDVRFKPLLREVNRRTESDPAGVSQALIPMGWWHFWYLGGGNASPGLRDASIAWLTWAGWARDGAPVVTLETWRAVIRGVDGRLSGNEVAKLIFSGWLGRSGPPWISGFEREQVDDLGRLASSMDDLSSLDQGIGSHSGGSEGPWDSQGAYDVHPHRRLFQCYREAYPELPLNELPEDALLWLRPRELRKGLELPELTVEKALALSQVVETEGSRKKLKEIVVPRLSFFFRGDINRVFDLLDILNLRENPVGYKSLIWRSEELASNLDKSDTRLKKFLALSNNRLPNQECALEEGIGNRLVGLAEVWREEYPNLARLVFSPPQRKEPDIPVEVQGRESQVDVGKLLAYSVDESAWTPLHEEIQLWREERRQGRSVPHPLTEIAEKVLGNVSPPLGILGRKPRERFEQLAHALAGIPGGLGEVSGVEPRLPALELMLSLARPGELGATTLAVIRNAKVLRHSGSQEPDHLNSKEWWLGLLETLDRALVRNRVQDMSNDRAVTLVLLSARVHPAFLEAEIEHRRRHDLIGYLITHPVDSRRA